MSVLYQGMGPGPVGEGGDEYAMAEGRWLKWTKSRILPLVTVDVAEPS